MNGEVGAWTPSARPPFTRSLTHPSSINLSKVSRVSSR